MAECSVDGCDGIATTRGWCQAHYMRWWAKGDVGDPEVVRRPKGRTCSVDGCERRHSRNGYCDAHWQRVAKYGVPGAAEIEARRPDAKCSVGDCDRPIRGGGLGFCNAHYIRFKNKGDPIAPKSDRVPWWTGDQATYIAVHIRLKSERGKASGHKCLRCGGPAQEWAYDHMDPDEKFDPKGLPYSIDLSHYQPLCRSCHRKLDSKTA